MVLPVIGQTYKVYRGDTINVVDANELKQGYWIEFNNSEEKILEKGRFVNGKKEGIWIYYYSSGSIKNEITYKAGMAIGPACFYYPDGGVSEKGFWNVDHWEGNYKYYHRTGNLAYDWNYNKQGKRTGEQKYFHENGQLKYEGIWDKGKTTGALKMYDDKGVLINERIYDDEGKFASNVKPKVQKKTDNEVAQARSEFKGTGLHTIYNLQGKPEKKGFFVSGELYDGEEYTYNSKGTLLEIKYYEHGEVKNTEEVKNPT